MPKPISIRSGDVEFLKLNAQSWEWRDIYQWLLSLTWPQFAAFLGAIYVGINLVFAVLYRLSPHCIADLPNSFIDAFFFSVQTLATVGYGHWYPQSLYGHIVSTLEIVSGMFGLAVITGLIFVRFSRPTARILFSKSIVIGPLDGKPTLMVRIGNLRQQSMQEARFRVMFGLDKQILEGESFRFFYDLKLHFDRIAAFPAALTLRHDIDNSSPLYGHTPESVEAGRGVFMVSVSGVDPVIAASVQTHQNYTWRDVRFNHRFVDIFTEHGDGRLSVDFGRIHDTQAAPLSASQFSAGNSADGRTRTGTGL